MQSNKMLSLTLVSVTPRQMNNHSSLHGGNLNPLHYVDLARAAVLVRTRTRDDDIESDRQSTWRAGKVHQKQTPYNESCGHLWMMLSQRQGEHCCVALALILCYTIATASRTGLLAELEPTIDHHEQATEVIRGRRQRSGLFLFSCHSG